ncbi:MAG: FdhF/YdeP family oxidoreductase [Bacteroidia bacterium]
MDKKNIPGAQPPEKFTGLKTGKPKSTAVGVPAVLKGLAHTFKYTGAVDTLGIAARLNQKGGFDCPGCAWPDPDDDRAKMAEYCENGLKAIAEEAQQKSLDARFFRRHSIAEMLDWSDFEIGKKGRLTEPMVLRKGASHYEPISWDGAFDMLAERLNALDTPDEAIFYTSGRTSNEAAFLYQLFVREFGTNNLPDCSNMCHESSGKGLGATLGIGKGSVKLEDLYEADVVMVMGQNPGTNHPRMLSALEKCKENGGKIITVNPLPEAGLLKFVNPQRPMKVLTGGTKLTDLFLQVRINGDVALLKAIMFKLLEAEEAAPGTVLDKDFIQQKTKDYDAFVDHLKAQDYNALVQASGIAEADILKAVAMFKSTDKIIICWAMGLTQHENGVENIQEVVNLLLMKGAIGKPGAGTCPVRGHSNVQGDRTMGIWEAPPAKFLDKIKEAFGFEPPREHGYDVVHAIKAMYNKKGKVFFAMGGNFLSASPDTEYTAEALQNCELTVHVSTKLNRSHLIHGDEALIFPCLGRTNVDRQESGKQFVSVENSMGLVHSSEGVLSPPSRDLLSEPAIVARMALATLKGRTKVDWQAMMDNYDVIRDGIEAVIPGFKNYNARVRTPNGFYLPNGPREGKFNTPSGKAVFTVNPVPTQAVSDGRFIMMTVRSHDQFNTTIYGLDDRYRGIYNERRVIMMNEADIAEHSLKKGDVVDITGHYGKEIRVAHKFIVVPYDIPRRCVSTYFPEANVLVPINSFARKSNTPTSKWIEVSLQKAT